MPTLGQLKYYKTQGDAGQVPYTAIPYGGNAPSGYTPVTREEYISGLQDYINKSTPFEKMSSAGAGAYSVGEPIRQQLAQAISEQGIYSKDYIDPTVKPSEPGQTYSPGFTRVTPTPGSGTYIEDLARSLEQHKIGVGSTAETNRLLGGQYFDPATGKQLQSFTPSVSPQTADNLTNVTTGQSTSANQNYSGVGTSDSERTRLRNEELARIKSELEPSEITKPTLYKSLDEFNKLRTNQGVVKDEEELAIIRNEAILGKEELRKFSATAGQGTSEGGRLGMMSEAERNLNFRLEGLAIREQSVLSRLNTKNSYIKTVLDLGQQDYQMALDEYNNAFNKNLKAIDLFNSQANDQQKDALTGITTIVNLLKDKDINFATLDPSIKTQLDTLSLRAGLPVGLIQQVVLSAPKDEIKTINERTDSSGNNYFDILRTKSDGSMYIQTLSRGKSGGGSGTQTIKSGGLVIPESTISAGQTKLDASRGSDGYANTDLYLAMLAAWKKDGGLEQDFFSQYPPKNYLNPNEGKGSIMPQYIKDKLNTSSNDEPLF